MNARYLALAIALSVSLPIAASPASAQQASQDRNEQQAQSEARAEAYIEAIMSEDFERFHAWYAENAETPISQTDARALFDTYIDKWGGVSPFGILAPTQNSLIIDARTGDGGTVSILFEFASEGPALVQRITPQYSPPPPPLEIPTDWSSLQELVDGVRESIGVPALAVGIYHVGQSKTAISGLREAGSAIPALIDDRFDWASVGKSVTGSVIASLVEEGSLRWDSTIGEILGPGTIHEDYRSVPLWMLASHQAGVPTLTDFDISFEQEIAALPGQDIGQKRAAYIRQLLEREPEYLPGTNQAYSNGGYMVLGYLAEVSTGERWDNLVRERVLTPLHLDHSRPTGESSIDMVAGHIVAPGRPPQPMRGGGPGKIPRFIAPAGGISGSIGDLTAFAATHLQGLNGQDTALARASTLQQLHSLQPGQQQFNGEDYSFGWGDRCVIDLPEDVTCRSHNGGNGFFFAQVLIIPEYNLALTLLANNTDMGVRALEPVFGALIDRYGPQEGPDQ